uniref:Uncharacterized protein n=1 Tax=Panagrolaimus superbus TaxID=310955 RepID=A0A914YN05_9BILA
MRTERSQRRDLSGNVKMEAAQGVSSGKKVIDVKDISFAFGERTMVRDFTTTILRLHVHPRARACADHPPVRWRAQPPAAGQAVRAAVQPAGDGRTDQRPRRGNPGAAGRAAGRVHRHAAAGQPRP